MAKEEQGVIIVNARLPQVPQSKLACIKRTMNERNKQIKDKEYVFLKGDGKASCISRPVKG